MFLICAALAEIMRFSARPQVLLADHRDFADILFAHKTQTGIPEQFFFFDASVFRAIRPRGPLDGVAEIDGPALETLVLQELRAVNEYRGLGYRIHYWHTNGELEVDIVLYGPRDLIAMRIKRARNPGLKDTRPLREFSKDYP